MSRSVMRWGSLLLGVALCFGACSPGAEDPAPEVPASTTSDDAFDQETPAQGSESANAESAYAIEGMIEGITWEDMAVSRRSFRS